MLFVIAACRSGAASLFPICMEPNTVRIYTIAWLDLTWCSMNAPVMVELSGETDPLEVSY